ncbi:MAG: type III pantothenate kinase [Gammaproteobacteria bacterium]|nr:type III pantothenate kinase [Gammaproteobacteria bacterium]
MPTLLLDVGNTRLKWASWSEDRLQPGGAQTHAGAPDEGLEALPAPAASVWVCDVLGGRARERLAAAIARRWGCAAHFAVAQAQWKGLRNGYPEPERLGADRWLAMIAARARSAQELCVVGAGTALTVDLVDAEGSHLGGVIAPGLSAMRAAVLGATRFEHRVAVEPRGWLGGDTEQAVALGALHAAVGLVERLLRRYPTTTGFVHGGDAARLLPHLGDGWHHAPDLVLEGLALEAAESRR